MDKNLHMVLVMLVLVRSEGQERHNNHQGPGELNDNGRRGNISFDMHTQPSARMNPKSLRGWGGRRARRTGEITVSLLNEATRCQLFCLTRP